MFRGLLEKLARDRLDSSISCQRTPVDASRRCATTTFWTLRRSGLEQDLLRAVQANDASEVKSDAVGRILGNEARRMPNN